jgi:hypothetical protein
VQNTPLLQSWFNLNSALNPYSALDNSNAELTKKLKLMQFFVRINPDKIFHFRQPLGQNTLMRILG